MGTTVILAYVTDNKIFIGHVGDSKTYLLRKGVLPNNSGSYFSRRTYKKWKH